MQEISRTRDIQTLHMSLPRPVRSIHQIELSSRCNLKCVYCPNSTMARPKIDMSMETYERVLEVAKGYVKAGTQEEISLTGTGESVLHPQFVEMVHMARAALGPDAKITFTTNGLICNEEMVSELAKSKPEVWVSLHRPEKAARAVKLYHDYGLLVASTNFPATRPNNWAGQVDWFDGFDCRIPCQWLRRGFASVLVDGTVTVCCWHNMCRPDGIIGSIHDDLSKLGMEPYSLCRTCSQVIGIIGHDQHGEKQ